jgi:hypothetical protein
MAQSGTATLHYYGRADAGTVTPLGSMLVPAIISLTSRPKAS